MKKTFVIAFISIVIEASHIIMASHISEVELHAYHNEQPVDYITMQYNNNTLCQRVKKGELQVVEYNPTAKFTKPAQRELKPNSTPKIKPKKWAYQNDFDRLFIFFQKRKQDNVFFLLGVIYRDNLLKLYHPTSKGKSVYWFEQGAINGNTDSKWELGMHYFHVCEKLFNQLPLKETPKPWEKLNFDLENLSKAIKWLEQASNEGYGDASCKLGMIFNGCSCGMSYELSDIVAVTWFKQGAKQNHKESKSYLGEMWLASRGEVAKGASKEEIASWVEEHIKNKIATK